MKPDTETLVGLSSESQTPTWWHQFYYKWFKNKVHFLFASVWLFIASDPLNRHHDGSTVPLLQENCHYCCHFGVLWHHSWSTNQTSSPDGNLDWCRTPEHDSSFTPGTRLRRRWKRFSSLVLLGLADDQKSSQWAAVSGAVGRCGSGHGEARARPGDDGGRGLCTCTGPVWAGPEGTGSVRAGTSFQLQPGAPDPQLTDASTWSWQRRRNVTT